MLAAKILIASLCIYLLVTRIEIGKLADALAQMQRANTSSLVLVSIAIVVLLLLNIAIETAKWGLLVHQYGISTLNALRQVLGGIAGGFLSPNRIGDPIVRSMLLPEHFRIRGLLPATLCSFSQLLATAIFGAIALMKLSNEHLSSILSLAITQFILIVLIGAMIWFAIKFFENRLGRIRFSKALVVVGLSLVRYFVFCLELWMIFLLLSPDVQFEPMFFAISLTYLANAMVPSFAVAELGVRAAGAAFFFPLLGINATTAVTATMVLWTLNVALPSIPGVFVISAHGISFQNLKDFKERLLRKEAEARR